MTDSQNTPPEPPKAPSDRPETDIHQQTGTPIEPQPNMLDIEALKRARNLLLVANIAGPVSILFGGVPLSTVGLVCAIIASLRFVDIAKKTTRIGLIAAQLKRAGFIAIGICGLALILNAIAFYMMLPELMHILESGDYSGLTMDSGNSVDTNSTWG